MPVTVRPASHLAREWSTSPATSALDLLRSSCRDESVRCKTIIQSSFGDLTDGNICPSSNGLVWAAFKAYNQHHHLSIRPEDVWFSILTQLSFYINANAEELRSFFVAHEGQKELAVIDSATIHTADFGKMAVWMTREMDKHLVDADLREWIMPNFTTTTKTDTITAAVLMMGSMQKYFTYKFGLLCGIPSVTLLGEKQDWVDIRRRLDKLPRFGKEPEQFSLLLSTVLDYFILSFESVDDPKVVEFWSKIAHQSGGASGPTYLSGWLTAFCFWDATGKSLYRTSEGPASLYHRSEHGCDLDGTLFHRVETDKIPAGYASVPVTVDDNGHELKTRMVAGSVGITAWSSGEKVDTRSNYNLAATTPKVGDAAGLDSLQPVSGWWMYELLD